MPPCTLDQPVEPGDLILLSTPDKAEMLFAKHTSDGEGSTETASITVKPISWRILIREGYWTLSGPRVQYLEEEEDDKGRPSKEKMQEYDEYERAIYDEDNYGIFREVNLSEFLYSFNPLGADDTGKGEDTKIIVNPHGRDVLKYYFCESCPECSGMTWVCQGCDGFRDRFPDLGGGCANKLACPFCMGYSFASEEWRIIRIQDDLSSAAWGIKQSKPSSDAESRKLEEEFQSAKAEFLELSRERYELINERKEEMGIELEDIDKLMKKDESIFE